MRKKRKKTRTRRKKKREKRDERNMFCLVIVFIIFFFLFLLSGTRRSLFSSFSFFSSYPFFFFLHGKHHRFQTVICKYVSVLCFLFMFSFFRISFLFLFSSRFYLLHQILLQEQVVVRFLTGLVQALASENIIRTKKKKKIKE